MRTFERKATGFPHVPSRAIRLGCWKIQEDERTFWTQDHYMEWFLAAQKVQGLLNAHVQ